MVSVGSKGDSFDFDDAGAVALGGLTLKATLVTGDDELRAELEHLTNYKLIVACAGLAPEDVTSPAGAMRHVLGSLVRRWLQLHEEIKVHSRLLKHLTKATAPALIEAFGFGSDVATELLLAAGDNTDRIRSVRQALRGRLPIPASSGKINGHRLNSGGNRQANSALYRTVIVRMCWHEPTNHRLTSPDAPPEVSRSARSSDAQALPRP